MFRFFVPPQAITGEQVTITGSDVQHIGRSLRLQPGDQIMIATGTGVDYLVEITELDSDIVQGKILSKEQSKGEPNLEVTLFQGLPKSDKMDLIVQKSTELGIKEIIPVETERTIVRLNPKKEERRIERWQRITEEAAKQSKRSKIPRIGSLHSWKEMQKRITVENFDLFILPWEEEMSLSIKTLLATWHQEKKRLPQKVAYIIGPEGGLSEKEAEQLKELGAQSVTLGPRILRTETAGFTLLTILMYQFNEMEGVGTA